MATKDKKKKNAASSKISKHVLYEASVQDVEIDYTFFQRVFKRNRGRAARTLREDFSGTSVLACEWARSNKRNEAWGVDCEPEVLEWGKKHRLCKLTKEQKSRVHLICDDVRNYKNEPGVDICCALNFSYSFFKERKELAHYFKWVYENLNEDGLFIIDSYGGPGAMDVTKDKRTIEADVDWAGNKYPKFKYAWDQSYFNFVNNHTICHIHFKVKGEKRMEKAFTYDWRLWGTPELRDIMLDVGFKRVDVYLEGWDEESDDTDGIMRKRSNYEHMLAWVSYMVAVK